MLGSGDHKLTLTMFSRGKGRKGKMERKEEALTATGTEKQNFSQYFEEHNP